MTEEDDFEIDYSRIIEKGMTTDRLAVALSGLLSETPTDSVEIPTSEPVDGETT